MIDQINRLAATGRLAIAPLNEKGLSVNPTAEGIIFVLADEKREMLRFYANAAPLAEAVQENPRALLNLLALGGPASPYADLRLGCDPYGRYLWISSAMPYADCTDEAVIERFARFCRDRLALTSDVIASINAALESGAQPSRGAAAPQPGAESARPAADAVPVAAAPAFETDEAAFIGMNPGILWG